MGRLAVDIGGTFTDLVHFDEESGSLEAEKSLSTPRDLTQGVLDTINLSGIEPGSGLLLRPRRHHRHQRHHRTQRRAHGARHYEGVPRRSGDC